MTTATTIKLPTETEFYLRMKAADIATARRYLGRALLSLAATRRE